MSAYQNALDSNDALFLDVLENLKRSSLNHGINEEFVDDAIYSLSNKYKEEGFKVFVIPGTSTKTVKKSPAKDNISWKLLPQDSNFSFTTDITNNNDGFVKEAKHDGAIVCSIVDGVTEDLTLSDHVYLTLKGLSFKR